MKYPYARGGYGLPRLVRPSQPPPRPPSGPARCGGGGWAAARIVRALEEMAAGQVATARDTLEVALHDVGRSAVDEDAALTAQGAELRRIAAEVERLKREEREVGRQIAAKRVELERLRAE